MASGSPADLTSSIVLLHGFTGSAESWTKEHRGPLEEAGCAIVAPDLPGHGRRGGDRSSACNLDVALDVVRAAVSGAAEKGGVRPYLVGYSMGGRIALHFAARFPESIAGLVLESSSPGLEEERDRAVRRDADAALADRLEREGIVGFVDAWEALPLFASQRRLSPETLSAQRARRLSSDPWGWAAALRGMGTGKLGSLWASLPDLALPTLVLVGREDRKFVDIGTRMGERLPSVRLEVIEGVGHNVHLEAPARWADAVLGFTRGGLAR